MRVALEGMPESLPIQPPEIITVNVDRQTGLRASPGKGSYAEFFRKGNAPDQIATGHDPESGQTESGVPDQLF